MTFTPIDETMPTAPATESALLLVVPVAEPAVARHRIEWDAAARVGVPAHVTVAYPFKPVELLDDTDVSVLVELCGAAPVLEVTFSRTGWFGDEVLFLEPDDAAPVVSLTRRIERAFPDYPVYGGVYDDVRPHLTIGHQVGVSVLRSAEREILPHLPLTQTITRVELWQGPPLAAATPGWHLVRSFVLGG
ncbi:2'-5' RNA ligase superfamily protein [Humibacillus xanthopallidus]|uniref:2'-5' RNA ligase superfamily protein n=1 Tax=Humibacillus xanthopallidus TaxID=412689 RepID=A0A543PL76_9MICO|nr:2'-5' RNA ligase family protein [Humibacillus xanthopallidus]TQN44799.1 2'-5' RNA ligase superfamily protein [Humibacillus xanthopallidus]